MNSPGMIPAFPLDGKVLVIGLRPNSVAMSTYGQRLWVRETNFHDLANGTPFPDKTCAVVASSDETIVPNLMRDALRAKAGDEIPLRFVRSDAQLSELISGMLDCLGKDLAIDPAAPAPTPKPTPTEQPQVIATPPLIEQSSDSRAIVEGVIEEMEWSAERWANRNPVSVMCEVQASLAIWAERLQKAL